jgi:hypothetical protein
MKLASMSGIAVAGALAMGCARESLPPAPPAPTFPVPAGYAWPPRVHDVTAESISASVNPQRAGPSTAPWAAPVSETAATPPVAASPQILPVRAVPVPPASACLQELDRAGIRYKKLDELRGVDTPIVASGPFGGVQYRVAGGGPMTADCRLILALVRIGPEVRALGIDELVYSGAYSYRFTHSGRLSLHGRGLAIDVHAARARGQEFKVEHDFARGLGACTPTGPLLNALACRLRGLGMFRELLTPDDDADHHDHLHLGIAPIETSSTNRL